ncbi:MAG: phage/plasmid primase, P4 family [Candidatus Bathyarchaeia archaeon]|jgi:P4 family phage/plasmid primase-like protien
MTADNFNPNNPNDFLGIKFTTTNPGDIPEPTNPEKQAFIEKVKAEALEAEKHVFACFNNKHFPTVNEFTIENEQTGEKSGFKTALIAEYLAGEYPFKTDVKTGILYFYNGKHWIANAEPYLEYLSSKILREEGKIGHYKNIAFTLKAQTYQEIEFSKKIACDNGLLDVETCEFTDFNAEEMPFHYIPVKYDPAATCPNWEEFIKQVVTADDILTLQEWSGYCLLPNYAFHKMMWIVGSGRNGKGVWQRTIEGILGTGNVSNIGLEEFDGSRHYSMYQLYGKLVNFCSEPRSNRELQTNLLKFATGQDTIEAEIKYFQKRLSFKNCAKITVLANKFPRVNDQTTAFKERRLFLKFPNEFVGTNQIINLEQIWLNNPAEKSGILNWMLKGLQRLLSQGYFTTSKTQEQTELEFLRASDSVSAFINETATYSKNLISTRSDAKDAYNAYCEFYGLDCENEKKLAAKLKDTAHIKDGATRINGKQERAWLGVNFKKLSEESGLEDISEAQTTLETAKSVTDVTDVTAVLTRSIILESSFVNKEGKTPVTTVTSVTNSNSELNAKDNPEKRIIYFERLAPNDIHHCDGLGHESVEAQFKGDSGFWCKSCLARIGKMCSENGFVFEERLPQENLVDVGEEF